MEYPDYLPIPKTRTIGNLQVVKDINLRGQPAMRMYWNDLEMHRTNSEDLAQIDKGALGNMVVTYGMRTSRAFRVEVDKHLDKIKTIFLLGG